MKDFKEINFLPKPIIRPDSLSYVNEEYSPVQVYANLFEIKFKKELKIYKYPFEVKPEIGEGNNTIIEKLFKPSYGEIKSKYGYFFISGCSLYSLKKFDEIFETKVTLTLKGKTEYIIQINKYRNVGVLKQEDIQKNNLEKQSIELIIKDVLIANPNIELFKDIYLMKNKKEKEEKILLDENTSFSYYPGFKTSFVKTEKGNYLNVSLKHKFIRDQNLLQYIKKYGNLNDKSIQTDINNQLIGRSFKVNYAKRNYKIDEILFDQSPSNHNDKSGINLIKYYKTAHNIEIKDKNQPLILVRRKDSQGNPINLYFIPELCLLAGLDDEQRMNDEFMKKVAKYTKLEPDQRVNETNKFIELIHDETENDKSKEKWSSKKKLDYYGIEVEPLKDLFSAYYMYETTLLDGKNKEVDKKSKGKINLIKKVDMINWIIFCDEKDFKDAKFFCDTLIKASYKYNININKKFRYEKINDGKNINNWINKVNKYFGQGVERKNDFALFLLGENNKELYPKLKANSLDKNGFVSQVVKVDTLYDNHIMSICSKILLQLNYKLGGALYTIKKEEVLIGKKIMVIGVDSSKHKDKNNYRMGIAMVASVNDTFTHFYNKVKIIKEENSKDQFHFCISNFIEEATEAYKKKNNGFKPDWIIIYRQGVSLQQKELLKQEIREIDDVCLTKNILYYYILVNTKSNFKFFEKDENEDKYYNPYSGLLVLDGVTNRNFFEFYIQPQQVNQGCATPTCYHVAYGNLNFPEIIPKFTFDLCHIYSNWEGSIRIPNVIKNAEKLSKMTTECKFDKLNKNLEFGQAYL